MQIGKHYLHRGEKNADTFTSTPDDIHQTKEYLCIQELGKCVMTTKIIDF